MMLLLLIKRQERMEDIMAADRNQVCFYTECYEQSVYENSFVFCAASIHPAFCHIP